jgi:nucleotide-binding universal stress UspA family protein
MLMPVSKILCATDFSEPSYEALKTGIELCSHFKAELCLVFVLPPIPKPSWALPLPDEELDQLDLAEYEEVLENRAQRKLHELITQRVPKEIKAYSIIGKGDSACEITRIAEDERATLIVLATHGMSGWRQVALGSVAERVVRLSARPVLTIRTAPHGR